MGEFNMELSTSKLKYQGAIALSSIAMLLFAAQAIAMPQANASEKPVTSVAEEKKAAADDPEVLISLVETALESDKMDTLRNIFEKRGNAFLDKRPLLAATAYIKLKDWQEAQSWLDRAEKMGSMTQEEIIHTAGLVIELNASNTAKRPIDGIVELLAVEVQKNTISTKKREEIAFIFLDLKAHEAALPTLKTLAQTQGGDWVFAYSENLTRLGRKKESTEFWASRAKMKDLKDQEKRDIGYLLMESRNLAAATEVFQELANSAAPESKDVEQLLYLWSPHPEQENLDWLVARGRSSEGETRALWMKYLIDFENGKEALRVVSDKTPTHPKVLDRYLEALTIIPDAPRAGKVILQQLQAEKDPERIAYFGNLADGLDQFEVARDAYQKLLQMKPDDAMVLKQLGTIHYNLKNWSEAGKYLRLHLDRVDGDWQVHYHLGEVHYITSRFEESKKYYRTALNKIHASNKHPYAMQVAQAHCMA